MKKTNSSTNSTNSKWPSNCYWMEICTRCWNYLAYPRIWSCSRSTNNRKNCRQSPYKKTTGQVVG